MGPELIVQISNLGGEFFAHYSVENTQIFESSGNCKPRPEGGVVCPYKSKKTLSQLGLRPGIYRLKVTELCAGEVNTYDTTWPFEIYAAPEATQISGRVTTECMREEEYTAEPTGNASKTTFKISPPDLGKVVEEGSHSATIQWNGPGEANLKAISESDQCGEGTPAYLPVVIEANTPPVINGPTSSVCDVEHKYTVAPLTSDGFVSSFTVFPPDVSTTRVDGNIAYVTFTKAGLATISSTVVNAECGIDKTYTLDINVSCTPTSRDKQLTKTQEIILYPNPVEDRLHFHNITITEIKEISVTNMVGEEVLKMSLDQSAIENGVGVENIAPGIYQIQLTDNYGNVLFARILKT